MTDSNPCWFTTGGGHGGGPGKLGCGGADRSPWGNNLFGVMLGIGQTFWEATGEVGVILDCRGVCWIWVGIFWFIW